MIRATVLVTPIPTTVGTKVEGRIGVSDELHPAHVSVGYAIPRTFEVLGSFIKSTGGAIAGLRPRFWDKARSSGRVGFWV